MTFGADVRQHGEHSVEADNQVGQPIRCEIDAPWRCQCAVPKLSFCGKLSQRQFWYGSSTSIFVIPQVLVRRTAVTASRVNLHCTADEIQVAVAVDVDGTRRSTPADVEVSPVGLKRAA